MNFAFILILSWFASLNAEPDQVLVFSKTDGYRHESIEIGVETLKDLGETHHFAVTHTEDAEVFTEANLKSYKLVIFINTSGTVLNANQKEVFKNYIHAGGNFMGVHGAAATEADWPWYGKLVGAQFLDHPKPCEATLLKTKVEHQSTSHLEDTWTTFDEWYNFKTIHSNITPVLLLDESTYTGGKHGDYHPISWFQEFEGGRSFYVGLGHTKEAYANPEYKSHLLGGILYCLNR